MKLSLPFYGRIFDVFSSIGFLPWFKGGEGVAKFMNSCILIFWHQLALIFSIDKFLNLSGKNYFSTGDLYYYLIMTSIFIFNLIYFGKFHVRSIRNLFLDVFYIVVFVLTLLACSGYFLFS